MWLKLPPTTRRGARYIDMQDMGQLYVMGSTVTYIEPGIYFADDIPLIMFNSTMDAEESLHNLFKAWARYRNSLYLRPLGLDWVIDPVLTGKEIK